LYLFGNPFSKKGGNTYTTVTGNHGSQSYRQEKSFQERDTAGFSTGGDINNSIDVNKSGAHTGLRTGCKSSDLESNQGDNGK
jgi:hypothetical protein